MGLDIKRNKKGEYRMISSISDESLHPKKKWVSEDEAKKILINRAFNKFVESAIEIDMTFPNGYHVNDKHHYDENKPDYHEWILKAYRSKDIDKIITEKFEEMYERLKLTFKI